MRIIDTNRALQSTFERLLFTCKNLFFSVAWASTDFSTSINLLKNIKKIKTGVVGTNFYQTDVDFIRQFIGNKHVKFRYKKSGVFHPKVYLFQFQDARFECLVGSANFTPGAFRRNSEVVIQIQHTDVSDSYFWKNLLNVIENAWNSEEAIFADDINLDVYEYRRNKLKTPSISNPFPVKNQHSRKTYPSANLLKMNWNQYFNLLSSNANASLTSRLLVLERAGRLFDTFTSLSAMPMIDRKRVAGFSSEPDVDWGYFGSMKGAGTFMNIVNTKPTTLDTALNNIPASGIVRKYNYGEYVEGYLNACRDVSGNLGRNGLSTATRLLAMKRPDCFLCIDRKNEQGIKADLQIKLNNHDYDKYWDDIIEPLHSSAWWRSACPRDSTQAAAWRGRAALVDALYYVPDT